MKKTLSKAFVIIISTFLFACAPVDTTTPASSIYMPDSSASCSEPQPRPASSENKEWNGPMIVDTSLGVTAVITKLGDYELPPVHQGEGFDRGIHKAKVNGVWVRLDKDGNVLPYDHMRFFDEENHFSIVRKEGKYGVVNAAYQLIVPAEYDQIFRAYKFERPGTRKSADAILYLLKDEVWSAVDINNRIQVSFESSSPKGSFSNEHSDFDVIVCNRATEYVKYYGEETALATELLFPTLNGQVFEVYSEFEHIGAYQSNMIPGSYGDEILMDFDLGMEGVNTVAVFGEIAPVTLTPQEEALVVERYPYSQYEIINKKFPRRAFQLGDTKGLLLEFYVTDKNKTVYHIFALSTPEQRYREVYRQQKPIEHFPVPPEGYDPTYSEVLFAGTDRNGAYHVVFLVAGKGLAYSTEVFSFTI